MVNNPDNFTGGKTHLFYETWCHFNVGDWVLDKIDGVKPQLDVEPSEIRPKSEIKFSDIDDSCVEQEVNKLLVKKVIRSVSPVHDQVISNVFVRKKKDGSFRMILNLKNLNLCTEKVHFKMENLKDAIALMKPGCYFASLDLKDAYYSVRIHPEFTKFFRFYFHGVLYEFLALPQGYRDSPRIFTKILKPILSHLRTLGYEIVMYIDDSLLLGDTEEECRLAVKNACRLLDSLGFTIHPVKSVFNPTQSIEFLGFVLNSVSMTVSLSEYKVKKVKDVCSHILESPKITIQFLAEVIGQLVATQPAIWIAPLFYKRLETLKNESLRLNKGDFSAYTLLNEEARDDLKWWLDNLDGFVTPVKRNKPIMTVTSDASKKGWGAECNGMTTGGMWTLEESRLHINLLELKAALFALKTFCKDIHHSSILIRSDNSTTVAHINHMGSVKTEAHKIIRELWLWCLTNDNFVIATFLPGALNDQADFQSRVDRCQIEWQLNCGVFDKLMNKFGPCDIDLFASRVNNQLPRYVSWGPDPYAWAIDSFTVDWSKWTGYIFPPFALILKVLQKIEHDEAECVVVVPLWTTQAWFPKLLRLLIDHPVLLPPRPGFVTHPLSGETHPKKMRLIACRVSGVSSQTLGFQQTLQMLSCNPGGGEQGAHINIISKDGFNFVLNKRGVLLNPL